MESSKEAGFVARNSVTGGIVKGMVSVSVSFKEVEFTPEQMDAVPGIIGTKVLMEEWMESVSETVARMVASYGAVFASSGGDITSMLAITRHTGDLVIMNFKKSLSRYFCDLLREEARDASDSEEGTDGVRDLIDLLKKAGYEAEFDTSDVGSEHF